MNIEWVSISRKITLGQGLKLSIDLKSSALDQLGDNPPIHKLGNPMWMKQKVVSFGLIYRLGIKV